MGGSCGEVAYVDEPAVVFLSRVGSRPTLNNKLGAFPFRIESGKKITLKAQWSVPTK